MQSQTQQDYTMSLVFFIILYYLYSVRVILCAENISDIQNELVDKKLEIYTKNQQITMRLWIQYVLRYVAVSIKRIVHGTRLVMCKKCGFIY